jgi:hypothetical protein
VAAESYLEAGHRGFFANGGTALKLYPALTARSAPPQEATCAPFARGISEVEPIWQVLRERAHALGYAIPRRSITPDLELHLLADGAVVPAQAVADGCLGFTVPPGTHSLRLVSRSFVPADHRPYVDDWRRLGVAVSVIALRTQTGLQEIAPDHPALTQGWHAAEREGALLWRWTSGDAVLPFACAEGGILELRVHATGDYEAPRMGAERRLAA